MQALRITTTAIEPIDAEPEREATLASSLAQQIRLLGIDPETRVHLGACDDEYNLGGGIFRECRFTVAELLDRLEAMPSASVCVVVEGAISWHAEVPDGFDVVQVTFYADLVASLPSGIPADL